MADVNGKAKWLLQIKKAIKSGVVSEAELLELIKGGAVEEEVAVAELFLPLSEWQVPPVEVIVEEQIIKGGVHVWAGLFESYKTMWAMETSHGLITGEPVGGYFRVNGHYPILYLCPDMPPSLFLRYAAFFGLDQQKDFVGLNPKAEIFVAIDNPTLKKAVRDRVLILDTMLDYARIKNAWESGEWVEFFQKLRALIQVHGCVAIILIAHPTKSGARNTVVEPTEFLKDSVTFGGKIDIGFAFCPVPKTSKIFIQRIKGRGFEKPITFTVAHHDEAGNSHISRGKFPVEDRPGEAGERQDHFSPKPGRPAQVASDEELDQVGEIVRANPKVSNRKLAEALGYGQNHHRAASVRKQWQEREAKKEDLPF